MHAVSAGCADCCMTLGKLLDSSEPQSHSCKMGIPKATTFQPWHTVLVKLQRNAKAWEGAAKDRLLGRTYFE